MDTLPYYGTYFLALWPLILIFLGVKTLFDNKSNDRDKILGAKLAIFTILGLIFFIIFIKYQYKISDFLDYFKTEAIFLFLITGLIILAFLQKIFPKWELLQRSDDSK